MQLPYDKIKLDYKRDDGWFAARIENTYLHLNPEDDHATEVWLLSLYRGSQLYIREPYSRVEDAVQALINRGHYNKVEREDERR